jgi:hypothetical protein
VTSRMGTGKSLTFFYSVPLERSWPCHQALCFNFESFLPLKTENYLTGTVRLDKIGLRVAQFERPLIVHKADSVYIFFLTLNFQKVFKVLSC